MTTLELMTIIAEQLKGWNVNGVRGILPHFNVAHFILAANESEQNVYVEEDTGDFPALDTTADTFSYNCDSSLWKLESICVRIEDMNSVSGTLINLTGFDYGSRRYSSKKPEYIYFAGRQYVRIPYVRSWPATETAYARLVFTADPGTASDYYKQYGFKKPTDIASTQIQVDIPPPWDYEYLIPATVKLIEGIQHGNYVEARNYIKHELKPALQKEMNQGEQGFDFEADEHGF